MGGRRWFVGFRGFGALAVGSLGCFWGCSSAEHTQGSQTSPPSESAAVVRPLVGKSWLVDGGRFALKAHGYRVEVADGAIAFPSANGASAPSFALQRLGRDSSPAPRRGAVSVRAGTLILDHDIAEEQLEPRPGGIEQRWVFAEAPAGKGDLVVSIATRGMTFQNADAQGLHFAAGARRLNYGASHWLDAHGKKTPIPLRYRDATIELRVPAHIVESAAYPAILDPLVSAELILAVPPLVPGGSTTSAEALGCSSEQCLLVWVDSSAGALLGRRTTLAGEVLDEGALMLGNVATAPVGVSADPAGEYLVTRVGGVETAYGSASGVIATRVKASDGSVLDVPPLVLDEGINEGVPGPEQSYPAVEGAVFNGGYHFVFFRAFFGSSTHRYVVRFKSGAAPSPRVDLGVADTDLRLAFASGGTTVAFAKGNRLTRIQAATGDILDDPPLEVSSAAYGSFAGRPTLSFDGESFDFVWSDPDTEKLYASRVRETDGALLDGSGARVLCSGSALAELRSGATDSVVAVTWKNDLGLVGATFALSPWTSSASACPSGTLLTSPASSVDVPALVGQQGVLMTRGTTGLSSLGFALSADGTSTKTHAGPLNFNGNRSLRGLFSNGRDFLLVSDPPERIDGVTGERLGAIARPIHLPVSANGRDYLATNERSEKRPDEPDALYYDLYRIRCDGRVGELHPLSDNRRLDGLSCDGVRCLGIRRDGSAHVDLFRYDRYGRALGTSAPAVDGDDSAVTADTQSAVADRNFVVVTRKGYSLATTRVSGETGNVSATATLVADVGQIPFRLQAASDGTRALVLWDTRAAVLKASSGAVLVSARQVPLDRPLGSFASIDWDGTSYIFQQSPIRRLNMGLQEAGDYPIVPADTLASNDHGRTLVAARAYLPQYNGIGVVGHFIDNDLSAEDPDLVAPNCGEGGAGNEGGEGGMSTGGGSPGGGSPGTSDNGGTDNNGGTGSHLGGAADAGASATQPGGSANTGGAGSHAGADTGGRATSGGSGPTAGGPSNGGTSVGQGGESEAGGVNDGSSAGTAGASDKGCSCSVPVLPRSDSWLLCALPLAALMRRRRKLPA